MDFLYVNLVFAVKNEGTCLPRISRETCITFFVNFFSRTFTVHSRACEAGVSDMQHFGSQESLAKSKTKTFCNTSFFVTSSQLSLVKAALCNHWLLLSAA
jgi:hypothetical protein